MPYVGRNAAGRIESVRLEPGDDHQEFVEPTSPELQAFVIEIGDDPFRRSDQDFVRVIEDVIYLLIDKGIIVLTDLPLPAQRKLADRRNLRGAANDLGGLVQQDEFLP